MTCGVTTGIGTPRLLCRALAGSRLLAVVSRLWVVVPRFWAVVLVVLFLVGLVL
ncbi:hypothetical protein ACQP1W_21005 [Spirillospora sp. CA-255316]